MGIQYQVRENYRDIKNYPNNSTGASGNSYNPFSISGYSGITNVGGHGYGEGHDRSQGASQMEFKSSSARSIDPEILENLTKLKLVMVDGKATPLGNVTPEFRVARSKAKSIVSNPFTQPSLESSTPVLCETSREKFYTYGY